MDLREIHSTVLVLVTKDYFLPWGSERTVLSTWKFKSLQLFPGRTGQWLSHQADLGRASSLGLWDSRKCLCCYLYHPHDWRGLCLLFPVFLWWSICSQAHLLINQVLVMFEKFLLLIVALKCEFAMTMSLWLFFCQGTCKTYPGLHGKNRVSLPSSSFRLFFRDKSLPS